MKKLVLVVLGLGLLCRGTLRPGELTGAPAPIAAGLPHEPDAAFASQEELVE